MILPQIYFNGWQTYHFGEDYTHCVLDLFEEAESNLNKLFDEVRKEPLYEGYGRFFCRQNFVDSELIKQFEEEVKRQEEEIKNTPAFPDDCCPCCVNKY
jgi:hypothetical protein